MHSFKPRRKSKTRKAYLDRSIWLQLLEMVINISGESVETDALGQINTPPQQQTLLSPDSLCAPLPYFFHFLPFLLFSKLRTIPQSLSTSWVAAPRASPVAQMVKNPPANAGDAGDASSIPGSGSSPGEGNGNPLQYYCLGNPMRRGAW